MIKEIPLSIFIVGTTAVGKTRLSLELSKIFAGQIINCDSKQLYKHANILTAKATKQQINQVPHHMLNHLELNEICYNRNKYFMEAKKCVDDIRQRSKIPIIIGGTNYYVQTLLYNVGIKEEEERKQDEQEDEKEIEDLYDPQLKGEIGKMTKQQKYKKLKQFDPVMAEKLHPNDEFRITSFLTRFAETGKPPSQNYKAKTHTLLNENSILFWVRNSNKNQIKQLMEKRIEKMISRQGLIEIFSVFRYAALNKFSNVGVLQSIGYKQFSKLYERLSVHPAQNITDYPSIFQFYLDHFEQIQIDKNVFSNCKEELMKNTFQYSKRQLKWIKNRLFGSEENIKHFFVLQLSGKGDLEERFEKQVKNKAIQTIKFIEKNGFIRKENIEEFRNMRHESIKQWKKYRCEKCQVEVNGMHEWEEHLKSRKHKGRMTKKQKKEEKRKQKQKILLQQDRQEGQDLP